LRAPLHGGVSPWWCGRGTRVRDVGQEGVCGCGGCRVRRRTTVIKIGWAGLMGFVLFGRCFSLQPTTGAGFVWKLLLVPAKYGLCVLVLFLCCFLGEGGGLGSCFWVISAVLLGCCSGHAQGAPHFSGGVSLARLVPAGRVRLFQQYTFPCY